MGEQKTAADVSGMGMDELMRIVADNDIAVGEADTLDEVRDIVGAALGNAVAEENPLTTVEYEGITVNVSPDILKDYSFIRLITKAEKASKAGDNDAELSATVDLIDAMLGDEWPIVEKRAKEKFGYVPLDFMLDLFEHIIGEMSEKNS